MIPHAGNLFYFQGVSIDRNNYLGHDDASVATLRGKQGVEENVFKTFTVHMIGPDGQQTTVIFTDIDDEDGRIDQIYAAATQVSVELTIQNPSAEVLNDIHSLQRESLGVEEGEEDPQETMIRLLNKPIADIPGAKPLGVNVLRNVGKGYFLAWQIMELKESEIQRIKGFGKISFNAIKSGLYKMFADAGVPLENVFGLDLDKYKNRLITPEG